MEEAKNAIDNLFMALVNFSWFSEQIEVSKDRYKTLIVYVDTMNKDILEAIPDNIDGFDIVVHYSQSISDKYVKPVYLNYGLN